MAEPSRARTRFGCRTWRSSGTQLAQWDGDDPDSIAARSVAYLEDLPTVVEAGIVPGTTTVWANFANGFDLVIPNNRNVSSQADTLADDSAATPIPSTAPARRVTIPAGRAALKVLSQPTSALELPEKATFRAINAIGTCHVNPLPVIRSLLTAGNYVNANGGRGTVNDFKNVSGDGVFYVNSHGGPGFDANQQAFYAIWTLDPIDVATLGNYRAMVANHELVGMLETSNDALGNCKKVMHYGFTSKFVRRHMSFPKNSVVIIDACSSTSGPAAGLRQAFQDKGASAYIGWSRTVDANFAYKAMKYLLDRLMGLNQISPESPKQRAFNIDDVLEDMATNRHLVTDPYLNAVLTVTKLKDDFGLLSPSIQFLSVESGTDYSELVIAGMFGTDPGSDKRKVKMNDQALDVLDWQPSFVRCDLPETGSNASGTVVVEVGDGATPRRSNAVNLTEWIGEMVYERDDPGDQAIHMTMHVRFRADIHSFRDKPGEQPFETTVLFNSMHESSVEIQSGGSFVKTEGNCIDTFQFGGSVNYESPYETSQFGNWNYLGSVDSQSHVLQLNMFLLALFPGSEWRRSGPQEECGAFTVPLWLAVQMEECLFDDVVGLTAFRMQMDTNYAVAEDEPGSVHGRSSSSAARGLLRASVHSLGRNDAVLSARSRRRALVFAGAAIQRDEPVAQGEEHATETNEEQDAPDCAHRRQVDRE